VRILQVAAEVQPFIKTGGLADVAGALPDALHALGHDVRVLMPGYGAALERARAHGPIETVHAWPNARLLAGRLPGGCIAWFYETPEFTARGGHPYDRPDATPWPDNAQRFAEFSRAAAALADDALGLGWRPDVVNAHDWHTALMPVYMMLARVPAASVFTIHNLAYQGLFEHAWFARLGMPGWLEHWQALEFRGQLCFMKGGIGFADKVSTVSQVYADEIRTPAFGEGMDGLLAHRGADLVGIVNGIDTAAWDPEHDPHIAAAYGPGALEGKAVARAALLEETGLQAGPRTPVLAYVGRLAEQKGVDLLLGALDDLLRLPAAVIILGAGDPRLAEALREAARLHPKRLHVTIGFDEAQAHRIYAGADMLAMPSRFEPCGLGQINAMQYGTIPVVRRTGGLAETVIDITPETLADGSATGFVFTDETANALLGAVQRARRLFLKSRQWRQLIDNAMARDPSWTRSARRYAELYRSALGHRRRFLGDAVSPADEKP